MNSLEALEKLKEGNARYLKAKQAESDISDTTRRKLKPAQHPFAVIIACSDSRVVPEYIFSCGLGDIFTVRIAGNVIDDHQKGSIEYAAEHLGASLVVVLGHTHCGAIDAAISDEQPDGHIRFLTEEIREAVGTEKDPIKASKLNAEYSARRICDELELEDIHVVTAIYDIETGEVKW